MTGHLQDLSAERLLIATEDAVRQERLSTAEVVRHFQEISDRKLYLERGFSSLFDMATRHFGYCASSAQRRIQSMRLVRDLPEVEAHLESGKLTLTAAANLQSFFYSETRENHQPTREEKLEAVEACLDKSTREVERELAKRNPAALKRETTRVTAEDRLSLHFSVSSELGEKMSRLKALLSHKNPKMGNEELLGIIVDIALEKLDPVQKARRSEIRKQKSRKREANRNEIRKQKSLRPQWGSKVVSVQNVATQTALAAENPSGYLSVDKSSSAGNPLPAQVVRSRHIPAAEKTKVCKKNNHSGCEFIDLVTGRKCCSNHLLQVDHIVPFSLGGSNGADNLRILCSQHNRLAWASRGGL